MRCLRGCRLQRQRLQSAVRAQTAGVSVERGQGAAQPRANAFKQLELLMFRTWRQIARDPALLLVHLGMALVVAVSA